jgi:hypothetical protein
MNTYFVTDKIKPVLVLGGAGQLIEAMGLLAAGPARCARVVVSRA